MKKKMVALLECSELPLKNKYRPHLDNILNIQYGRRNDVKQFDYIFVVVVGVSVFVVWPILFTLFTTYKINHHFGLKTLFLVLGPIFLVFFKPAVGFVRGPYLSIYIYKKMS